MIAIGKQRADLHSILYLQHVYVEVIIWILSYTHPVYLWSDRCKTVSLLLILKARVVYEIGWCL